MVVFMSSKKNYIEDMKLSFAVYNKYFKKYSYLKEDLIQESIVNLWKGRKFYNKSISSYSTYAFGVSLDAMVRYLRKNVFDNISLETPISEELRLIDVIPGQELKINDLGLDKLIKQVKKNTKKEYTKYIEFIDLFCSGLTCKEITEIFNCSRQFTSKLLCYFRKDLSELMQKKNVYGV